MLLKLEHIKSSAAGNTSLVLVDISTKVLSFGTESFFSLKKVTADKIAIMQHTGILQTAHYMYNKKNIPSKISRLFFSPKARPDF